MTYDDCIELVDYLNKRMYPCVWYKWSVKITWEKLKKWREMLEAK